MVIHYDHMGQCTAEWLRESIAMETDHVPEAVEVVSIQLWREAAAGAASESGRAQRTYNAGCGG